MGMTLIVAHPLVDGASDISKKGQAVLIRNGRIDEVGDLVSIKTPADHTIALGDDCLAPGLIDGHTHISLAGEGRSCAEMFCQTDEMMLLTGAMNLKKHLDAGITTI